MSSQIDETLPIFGEPTTASVRANFATAKAEISALQGQTAAAPFLPLAGGHMTGPFYLYNDPTDVMMPATKGYVDAQAGGGGGGGIPEAPADGNTYGRHTGAWLPVLPMTGGTLTGLLTLSGPPTATLHAATKAYVDAAPNLPITISGDATGSGAATIPLTLATVLTSPGVYQGLTLDAKGRVTAAANMNYALLASPTFTGTPTAPTPATADSTTKIATTAFVKAQGYATGGPYLPLLGGLISGALTVAGAGQVNGTMTIGSTLQSGASGGVCTFSMTPSITGLLTAAGGVNCSGGTLTVGPTINFGGTGGVCTINGSPTFSGQVTLTSNLISYSAILPGGDNSCSVGNTGQAFNQMNAYVFITNSDRRQKTEIADLPQCLDLVRGIAPKIYRLREGEDNRPHWGFIAQDVGAAMTSAGHDFGGHVISETGREALSYNDLVATLWQAVRELADEIAELKEARS